MNTQNFKLYLSLVLLFSCSEPKEKKILLLIPGSGCPSCIQIGKKIAQEIVEKPCVEIVFTNVESIKFLKIEMGYTFFEKENVTIDTENKLRGKVSSLPILFLEASQIEITSQFFKPEEYSNLVNLINCSFQ